MSDPVALFLYYPLRDRLPVDLYRDLLIQNNPYLDAGPLTDRLVDDHPLPHFRIDCPADRLDDLLDFFKQNPARGISIKIDQPETIWIGRNLDNPA